MTDISNVVEVTTSLAAKVATSAGFGIPLVVGFTSHFTERVRTYTKLSGLTDDGFLPTDAIYRAARAIFSQKPTVQRIKVGRQGTAVASVVTLTPVVANLAVYTVTLGGVSYTFTSDSSATAAEIVAGLLALINVDTATHGVTASGTATLILTSTVGLIPELTATTNLTSQTTTADPGIAADLNAIIAEDADFYGVVLTGTGKAEILAAAVAVETLKRQLFAETSDSDVISTAFATGDDTSDDVATRLKNLGYTSTHLSWTRAPGAYMNGAVAGDGLRNKPGSTTYALRSLVGISADVLTDTQTQHLFDKNVNFMMSLGGLTLTSNNGTNSVGAPYYTDIKILADYFDSNVATLILSALAARPPVPFTDEGFSAIKGVVMAFFKKEEARGVLIKGTSVVTVPKRKDVSVEDAQARFLNGMTYAVVASGFVHKVAISGVIANQPTA